ncbi:MAG: hypothetical protein ACSLFF_04610 [Solirubrobacterales bacterium]
MAEIRVGVSGFVADLRDAGIAARELATGVEYSVSVALGPLAGFEVRAAVATSELAGWPAVPPHWIHLPGDIQFPATNSQPSEVVDGWVKHSRDLQDWAPGGRPGQEWIAHVQAILEEALANAA